MSESVLQYTMILINIVHLKQNIIQDHSFK
jgi:hypothetical protein